MLGLNKVIAWCLIFFMFMGSFSQFSWAADAPKRLSRKKRSPKKAKNLDSSKSKSKSTASKKKSANKSTSEKSLTKLQTSVVTADSKLFDAKNATKRLAPKNTPWTEEIDLLSAADQSPILADSVFGARGKQKINLSAADLEIKVIMDQIAAEYRLNIVSKSIGKGNKIKAVLYDLPLETVFQVLLDQANLTYIKKNGIIYLQDSKVKDQFLDEQFFKLKQYADFEFALKLIENIATSKGKKVIKDPVKKTVFVIEYKRNLRRINKVLEELGYLEEMDPESSNYHYHYLSYSYVEKSVVSDIIKKYASKEGKSSNDEKSNRYLVFDTKSRFNKMKEALEFIDVPRGQVFIDVMFVDLNESDVDKLGIDTAFNWNKDSPDNADQLITSLSTDVTNFFKFSNPSKITNIKVTGIKTRSKSRILNNPRIMVLNNEKATIDVTEKFPFVTNENKSGVVSSKIQNVDIGVTLTVTPRINANREVEMHVNPRITVLKEVRTIITKVIDTNQANAQATETSSEFPIIDERSIDTTVVIPSGKTLVIGGLIKENDRKAADSIPGLSRLPIFGSLFKRKNNGGEKSQLYIFITPTIVRNAPKSTTFTTDYGDERLVLFPKGSIEEEKNRISGLIIENSDGTPLSSPSKEKNQKKPRELNEEVKLSKLDKSKFIGDSPVDFSSFLKKIKYLKEKKNISSLKNNTKKRKRKKKEKGFDNLIKMLEKDIVKSEKYKIEKKQEKKEKTSLDKKIHQKKKDVSDKIIGDRAQKIANLLNLWEEDPKDTMIADEDKKEFIKSAVKEKKLDSIDIQKEVTQKKQANENNLIKVKTQKPRVIAPLVEDAIVMELLSPLDMGGFDKAKLLDVGKFNLGNIKFFKKKSKSSLIKPKKKRRPKKRRRKKKLSYLEINEDLDFINTSEKVNFSKKVLNKKDKVDSWEEDFFQKDLAFVVYNEEEEIEETLHRVEKKLTKKALIKPKPKPRKNKKVKSQLASFINSPKKKKTLRTFARSSNPRTQQIFDNLLLNSSPKNKIKKFENKKVLARSSDKRTQDIFNNLLNPNETKKLKKRNLAKLEKPVKNKEESDFESFLDDMFVGANEPLKKSKTKIQKVKKLNPKIKKSLTKLEKEFMSFLEEL
ncbi:MAG: hypothetical protein COB02_09965 [Candidatus Cloacimonadota bacterium]|nr:MAG: hypothetical protein COB02_09965 [Candidatus Cloacimonadota bacterium]